MSVSLDEGVTSLLRSTQQFIQTMQEKDIRYKLEGTTDSGKDIIIVSFSGDYMTAVTVKFFFSKDCEDVALRVFDMFKVPEQKTDRILEEINAMNNKFRFAKFCLDMRDSTVQMEMDAAFREHDVGEICCELLARAVDICDEAYQFFMKSLWG